MVGGQPVTVRPAGISDGSVTLGVVCALGPNCVSLPKRDARDRPSSPCCSGVSRSEAFELAVEAGDHTNLARLVAGCR